MNLDIVTREDAEKVRTWRNADPTPYRTPYKLTEEMQKTFYDEVINNRHSDSRYFSVNDCAGDLVGMVGLVNISLENRCAELSMVIDPDRRGQGLGRTALDLLLDYGFNVLNLDNIYGECYKCSKSASFWRRICIERSVKTYDLPRRVFRFGQYHDSIYFNFERE